MTSNNISAEASLCANFVKKKQHIFSPLLTKVDAGLLSTSKINQINGSSEGQPPVGRLGEKRKDKRKLFVGRLPLSVDDQCLFELFSQFGELRGASVGKDANTGVSRGYAMVTYRYTDSATKARKHMHGFQLEGRTLKVQVWGLSTKTLPGPDCQKTIGHHQTSQSFLAVPQLSPVQTSPPVALSFPQSSTPVQHHMSSLSINAGVLLPVIPYLASTVPFVATTYNSPADLVNFAGILDKLPSPFSMQLGKPSSGIFSLGAASASRHLATSGSHIYPLHTAAVGSNSLVTPISANGLPPLSRPYLAAAPSESLNFPGNPDTFRSRFL